MHIPDRDRAEHYLQFIGYYRLSGYWFPFQHRDGSINNDVFRAGTNFETILERYVFDRRLRMVVMDAVERIEVAARAVISNTMSAQFGPHWFLDASRFRPGYNHTELLRVINRETGISPRNRHKQTQFIHHYVTNYHSPSLPPSWMIFEVLSFGVVSRIFANIRDNERRMIANEVALPRDRLESWLHAIAHLRNFCAHHSRVWNREFRVTPSIPRPERSHVTRRKRLYAFAVAIQILVKRVSGDTHWSDRLEELFQDYPAIPIDEMGFPSNWRAQPVWN